MIKYLYFPFLGITFLSCLAKKEDTIDKGYHRKILFEDKPISEIEFSMLEQGLVNIKSVDSNILVDLKYSSRDNYFGEDVYGNMENAYLQVSPALALAHANELLMQKKTDYRIIVYDAARPLRIQHILWQRLSHIPTKRRTDFVANPRVGSIHNYGCAVDISIYDLKQNKALDMGTKYDYFGHLAYPRLEKQMLKEGKITLQQVQNRILLRAVCIEAGFSPITSEWWHFNYFSRKKATKVYPIIK